MTKNILKSTVCLLLIVLLTASVAMLAGCGSKVVTVPDLVGNTKEAAEKELSDLGLTLTVQRERFSKVNPKDSVDEMVTKAGTEAEAGSEVQVVLSLGEGRTVPNVYALTAREAENLIRKVDLNPIMVEEYSDDVPEGGIISCSDSGQIIAKGSDVTVTVSKGPAA